MSRDGSGQGMRQPQLGGSNSQLAPTPVLGRNVRGMKTVTINGIGTAEYTLPEWRHIKRRIDSAASDFERKEALMLAEVTHALKVNFPGPDGCVLVTDPEDEKPLPEESGEQMGLLP